MQSTDDKNQLAKKILTAFFLALIFFGLFRKIPFPQEYPEFIVGEITFEGKSKVNDLIILPLVCLVYCFFYIYYERLPNIKLPAGVAGVLSRFAGVGIYAKARAWMQRIKRSSIAAYFKLFCNDDQMLLWLIPAIFFAASFFHRDLNAGGALFLLVFAAWVYVRKRRPFVGPTFAIAMFASTLLFFLPNGIFLPFERIFPTTMSPVIIRGVFLLQIALVVGFIIYSIRLQLSENNEVIHAKTKKLLILSQLFLPLLLLSCLPSQFVFAEGGHFAYSYTSLFPAVLGGLLLIFYAGMAARWIRYKHSSSLAKLISPFALFALLFFIYYPFTNAPQLPMDDYHFGELLHGFRQYFLHGTLPYIGFTPPHGPIIDDLAGFFGHIFFDGTAGVTLEAHRLQVLFLMLLAAGSLQFFGRNTLLTVFSMFFMLDHKIMLAIIPMFSILLWKPDERSYWKWLLAWSILAAYTVLAVPPQGILAVCATGFAAFVYFVLFLKSDVQKKILLLIPPVLVFGALAVSPLRDIYLASYEYVLGNGALNHLAWGITWVVRPQQIVSQVFRASWILVPILTILFLHKSIIKKDHNNIYCIAVSVSCALFCLACIPYSMGRIDLGEFSRMGLISLFSLCTLIPIMYFHRLDAKQFAKMILILTFAVCMLSPQRTSVWHYTQALPGIQSSWAMLVDGEAKGISSVGKAVMDPDHLNMILRLDASVKEEVGEGQYFYNATVLSALYRYINRPLITSIFAPLNAPYKKQQRLIIEELEQKKPQLILLSVPGYSWTHTPLRTYYLYRYIVDNYQPVEINGLFFGRLRNPQSAITPEGINILKKIFTAENLYRIPESWGRSKNSLAGEMSTVIEGPVAGSQNNDSAYTFSLKEHNFDGMSGGLLVFYLNTDRRQTFKIGWEGEKEDSDKSFAQFSANSGWQIVPLDTLPSWFFAGKIQNITIESISSKASPFTITKMSIAQRNPL